ncbi:hypothetical protein EV401DRAFT_1896403 [Pisolithus croceorrhizus]|nr:hypothetical protein EV401DRAFT_1896403 [Pisolithus croceorrhizus]
MAVKRHYTKEGFVYVLELKKNGQNWKEYCEQVLEVTRIQNLLRHLAGVEQKLKVTRNELNEWLWQNISTQQSADEGCAQSCTKPKELSVELPSEERLKDRLTKVKEHLPEVPSKLQEQLSLRAGEPLESKHPDVLNGLVEVPYKVEDVDRAVELAGKAAGHARGVNTSNKMACKDLPSKPLHENCCLRGSRQLTMDVDTSIHGADVLSGGSGMTNSQSHYTEKPQLTVYNPGSTLQWPMAHSQEAEMDEGGCRVPLKGELTGCMSDSTGESTNILLEGEMTGHMSSSTRCMSSNKRNLQGCKNTLRVLGIGDINVPTPQNVPIEALSSVNQDIKYEGHVARGVKGEITGGDGKLRDDKSDTRSSGNVNSKQVKVALLARGSQDAYQGQNKQSSAKYWSPGQCWTVSVQMPRHSRKVRGCPELDRCSPASPDHSYLPSSVQLAQTVQHCPAPPESPDSQHSQGNTHLS